MLRFRSYRSKLQAAFVALGISAIAVAGWVASAGASDALRRATFERLNAVRETRVRQIERYFEDAGNQLLALSSDESTVQAIEEFRAAWPSLPWTKPDSKRYRELRTLYEQEIGPLKALEGERADITRWLPRDPQTWSLQYFYVAANKYPAGSKDLLLNVPKAGAYGRAHARHHPTLQRYQGAFGFYDVFLIDAADGRILYTVRKEIDLGMGLSESPYRETALARAFERARKAAASDPVVVEDYQPYAPSYFAPAAFLAAPVWRAGVRIGVIAIQVSIEEVNRVMTGEGRWREEGLGDTGHAYLVGSDGTLRSDVRFELESPENYYIQLERTGVDRREIERIRRYKTGILNFKLTPQAIARVQSRESGLEEGTDFRGISVLRSHSRLRVPDLGWAVVAEMETGEAFAPVRSLQYRIFAIGLLAAGVLFFAARWLAVSVTRAILSLAEGAARLGGREFGTRVPVETTDEIGQLAQSFNRMAENLEKTTVSREELEVLAGRLITAQEEERTRIARDLHDDLSQRLAALAIEAGNLEKRVDSLPEDVRKQLDGIRRRIAGLGNDVHGIARRLHPATLEDLGLIAAIESECRGFFERGGPPVDFDYSGSFEDLPSNVTLTLYRVVQESLHNIQKYAGAQEVKVSLVEKPEGIELTIRDDGAGFDRFAPDWHPGLGLASMEERAKLLGGRFRVDSAPGQGTTIFFAVPSKASQEKNA
jgi:signal transduction histidine kinase